LKTESDIHFKTIFFG